MNQRTCRPLRSAFLATLALALAATFGAAATAQEKGTTMRHAKGEFEVKVTPLALAGPAEDPKLARLAIEKTFHGPLAATGRGQMLTSDSEVKGSAVYVAVERVTGILDGKKGTFALHHRGVMTRGEPLLSVLVVPDSGTGELAGLTGTLHIIIEGGKHFYDFEYELPAAP
jgi:Protein of unknown function (DUF3224)